MLIEVKNGASRFIRESWKEWLFVDVSNVFIYQAKEGERIMPFYLPVYRQDYKDAWTCAILPLVPFILVFVALKRGLRAAYNDIVYTIDQWRNYEK